MQLQKDEMRELEPVTEADEEAAAETGAGATSDDDAESDEGAEEVAAEATVAADAADEASSDEDEDGEDAGEEEEDEAEEGDEDDDEDEDEDDEDDVLELMAATMRAHCSSKQPNQEATGACSTTCDNRPCLITESTAHAPSPSIAATPDLRLTAHRAPHPRMEGPDAPASQLDRHQ